MERDERQLKKHDSALTNGATRCSAKLRNASAWAPQKTVDAIIIILLYELQIRSSGLAILSW